MSRLKRIVAISIDLFGLISNIIRNTLGDFMWKCRWNIRWRKMCAFLPAECLHRIPCLFHVWTLTGACPTHRRQWADFLVSLMAPLHRQYKTARTETRRHLLLKIRQMPTQTSASRGYVLFRGAHKGHTQKSYKLSSGMRT